MLIATTELIFEKIPKATDFKTVIRAGSSRLILELFLNHEKFFIKKSTTKGAAKTIEELLRL